LCFKASSGKDRRLCLWYRNESALPPFLLASSVDSAHKRIVWGLNFCPFDPSILASGSRDGCVKIWKISDAEGDGVTSTISEIHL
jgi:WD40 repeat protein